MIISSSLTCWFKAYARNYPRSGLAKQFVLAGRTPTGYLPDLYTDDFWDEVDSVTTRILSLLMPLINMLGALSPGAGWPPLTKVHQDLHNIVAEAGWLTNGMRVSKSVFWVQFPNPGDLWDIHQEHATDSMWNGSKAAAARHDALALAKWTMRMETEWIQTYGGQAMDIGWRREYEKQIPPPRQPRRSAKVQIVLWPWINQYSPVRPKSDGDLNSGEIITQIVKAQVVYYAGDDSDEGEMRERLTLEDHIRESKRWTTSDMMLYLLVLLFVIFLMHEAYKSPYLDGVAKQVRRRASVERVQTVTALVQTTDVVVVETPLSASTATVSETATVYTAGLFSGPREVVRDYVL